MHATAAVCMMQTMAITRASGTSWPSSSVSGKAGRATVRQMRRQGAEHGDAASIEMEQGHGETRRDQADQRARDAELICAVTMVTTSTPTPIASA